MQQHGEQKWQQPWQRQQREERQQRVQTFVSVQTLEIRQLIYNLAFDNVDNAAFYEHLRRALFSIMMTAVVEFLENSAKLERSSKMRSPSLARLPTWMQPSTK